MGLLDTIAGALGNAQGEMDAGQGDLLGAAMSLINSEGGLAGLVQKFESSGLKEQVASWISTGSNLPISAEQIQFALGSGTISDIAAKLGVDTNAAASHLANFLPQVIDRMTPDGQISGGNTAGDLLAGIGNLFGGNKSA